MQQKNSNDHNHKNKITALIGGNAYNPFKSYGDLRAGIFLLHEPLTFELYLSAWIKGEMV
jgi:hypothetical protein